MTTLITYNPHFMLTRSENSTEFHEDPIVVEKPEPRILFIGKHENNPGPGYTRFFSDSLLVDDFEQARNLLSLIEFRKAFPDLIVIDEQLNFLEFTAFRTWMKENLKIAIPVIYNETRLLPEESTLLFKLHLADDVTDLQQNFRVLPYKARFLKKVAEKQANSTPRTESKALYFNCRMCFVKRTLDVVLSLVAIILLSPIFILIALAVLVESRGPIIYSAERAGRGFRVFRFFKFRTMVVDADKKVKELSKLNLYDSGANKPTFFKVENDPRVTRVGAILRNTSLDELPQLFNVLKGDMSIVGNRPLPLYEAATLTTNEWAERFMAPAGITGLWQVKKRGMKDMSVEERLNLDINYARNNNLVRDLWIMAKTPSALLQKSNV